MSYIKDGGSAFSSHGSMGEVAQEGMTLRDYFAAHEHPDQINFSLAEALAGKAPATAGIEYVEWIAKWQSKWRYIQADAMIKARG